MTPTTAREFAERLLDGCTLAYDGTLPFIRRRLDEAAALIEADREAIRREALEPFVEFILEFRDWAEDDSEWPAAAVEAFGRIPTDTIARLLPPAEKAGPT
jgi:predicted transcriptional regulator